jgi:hypothetical protein
MRCSNRSLEGGCVKSLRQFIIRQPRRNAVMLVDRQADIAVSTIEMTSKTIS